MEYKLSEIFDLQMGKTPDRSVREFWVSGIKPWISISDLSKCGKYIEETAEYISEVAVERSGIKVIPANTVIMSFKLSIGKVAITAKEMYSNEAIMAFINKGEAYVEPSYLYYLLMQKEWNSVINKAVMGKTLNKATMSQITVNIHRASEQYNIIRVLDKVSDIIVSRKHQLVELQNLIKARFVEMFGDPVQNTMKWETKRIQEIATKIGSGATPKGGKENYRTEGVSLIRSMNVHNGRFEYKELAHISDEQADKLNNVTIEQEDVLLNITGASVARCCIVPNDIVPARVNQHVCVIRCGKEIKPLFLSNVLTDVNYQKLLWEIAGGGATREAITKQQIENLRIILPPIEMQNQFYNFVTQVDKSKVVNCFAIKILKDNLYSKLIIKR